MKREWENPKLNNLVLENTKAVEPIILILQTKLPEPMYAWKCPCCGTESGYIFNSDQSAKNDFYSNHLPNCSKYNYPTDSCIIS